MNEDMDEIRIPIDESMVILEGPEYTTSVNGQTIHYRDGVWCEKDDEEWKPDGHMTYFYLDRDHPENYLYYERDRPETALHNLTAILIATKTKET